MTEIEIEKKELKKEIGDIPDFPKYFRTLINRANRFSQATRPKVVGQMSELVKECPHDNYEEWKGWYQERKPDAIEKATEKNMEMLRNFREVLENLDRKTVRGWVKELVLVNTFIGFNLQEPILKRIASIRDEDYRLSTPEEESKGIDGFIGETPVSIKPSTYEGEKDLKEIEGINIKLIVYEEKDDKVIVYISEITGEKQAKLSD